MSGITDILTQTELFGGLKDEVLETLAKRAVERSLERGEHLFIAGEPAEGLFVVAEGSLRAYRSGLDGREQVIHVERAVTTIAEVPVFDGGAYPSSVAAEEPTRVYFINKADIRTVAIKHPDLALAAASVLAGRLRKCAELVELLSLREVSQRVAGFLSGEALTRGTPAKDGVRIEQVLTHNQLAARLGTVREVVTRALTRLQAQGLISVKGKRIMIHDPEALRAYSESS